MSLSPLGQEQPPVPSVVVESIRPVCPLAARKHEQAPDRPAATPPGVELVDRSVSSDILCDDCHVLTLPDFEKLLQRRFLQVMLDFGQDASTMPHSGVFAIPLIALLDREFQAQRGQSLRAWADESCIPYQSLVDAICGSGSSERREDLLLQVASTLGISLTSMHDWCTTASRQSVPAPA